MSKTIYTHKHHIIPRHAGGTDEPSNLIELTVEGHALAHKKLYEEHGRIQDKLAWKMLEGTMGKDELMREKSRLGGQISSTKGIPKSEDHKKKMSEAKLGVKRPYMTGTKHPMYGSEDQSKRINKLNNTVSICPICGYEGKNYGNMKRWHFDNCKAKSV